MKFEFWLKMGLVWGGILYRNKRRNRKIVMRKKRKWYFRFIKKITRCKYKQPTFVFLGEKFEKSSIVLSNHEGTDAPMSLEIYYDAPLRMWGAYQMNSGVVKMYQYQTRVYYHEKKGWNIHLARLFCLLASPLTNLFYKGLDLISTYRDSRFLITLRESIAALKAGENIVIFPEDSKNGYLAELEGFYNGFALLAELCEKKGVDAPIYVTYFQKKTRTYVIDKPVYYRDLKAEGLSREEIVAKLLARCNELGKMQFDIPAGVTEYFVEKDLNALNLEVAAADESGGNA